MLRFWIIFLLAGGLICPRAQAQQQEQEQAPEQTIAAAFTLAIEAPDTIRKLLERHLDLLRYR